MGRAGGISSFPVLLMTGVIALIGLSGIGRLNVQYSPSAPAKSISVSFTMAEASAYAVETEATAVIEGALSRLDHVKGTSSVSQNGSGRVTVSFDKKTDMSKVRLDVSSAVRNIYESLPDAVSYPEISLSVSGEKPKTAISYTIKGDCPSRELELFAENTLYAPLTAIEGVDRVSVTGGTPWEWVITFNSAKCEQLGISSQNISQAVSTCLREYEIGRIETDAGIMNVRLKGSGLHRVLQDGESPDFSGIPVASAGGKMVHLGEISESCYKEAIPSAYFRVNGLNTVSLSVGVTQDANILATVKEVRETIDDLKPSFPGNVSASVSYDYTEYISSELQKLVKRTLLCLLLLLLFVAVTSRSLRYTLVMALTLAVNLSAALAIYWMAGLRIHIYTLAGITISLGIIIDSSIVMVDHYSRYGNRAAMPALVSAVLTTVAALMVVFLLPEKDRAVLTDFIWVIVINLSVSLLVAWLFVPALLDTLPLKLSGLQTAGMKRKRRTVRWNRVYERSILFSSSHKWMAVLLLVIAFGVPTCLLPNPKKNVKEPSAMQKCYSWLMTESPYGVNRKTVDKIIGSTFAAFNTSIGRSNFYREPSRRVLFINAGLPEGRTIEQLNGIVQGMERYLAGFEEISVFTTSIYSSTSADIEVMFKDEFENTSFPDLLKEEVTRMAVNFGGANWRISGVNDNYFNNNVTTVYRTPYMVLRGYNFGDLLAYADSALAMLARNPRVVSPVIQDMRSDEPRTEYALEYDFESMTRQGLNPYQYYSELRTPLCDTKLATLSTPGFAVPVVLQSDARDSLDLWNVINAGQNIKGREVKLGNVGSIEKKPTGFPIRKSNQSYEVGVCYEFVGSYQLASKVTNAVIDHLNDDVLPVGFKASSPSHGRSEKEKERYIGLILLVIAAIFVICSMSFESIRLPLSIVSLIPVSFVGLFLVFGLTDIPFDQGGFAAMVVLCGISVNAGIYLLYQYRGLLEKKKASMSKEMDVSQMVALYVKAFDIKIVPILLTILSTALGLVPFLFDGPKEVFWFDFALGIIAGIIFSIIAIVIYLPTFLFKK